MMNEDDLFSTQAQKDPMDRTAEVKERLWPMMQRMKASLDKIERLEDSIAVRREADRKGSDVTQDLDSASVPSQPANRASKRLLRDTATMVTNKLSLLQRMEETLSSQEDRRQILQHHIIQTSLSVPCLEICEDDVLNNDTSQNMHWNSHQASEGKCEEAQSLCKNARLEKVVEKLREALAKNKLYEYDLQDRQSKINTLSIRCDDLELQVEHLRAICDSLHGNPDDIADASSHGSIDVSSQDSCDAPPKSIGDDTHSTALTQSDEDSLTVFSSAVVSASDAIEFSHLDEDIATHFRAEYSSNAVIRSPLTRVGHLERSDAGLKRLVLNKSTPLSQNPSSKPYGKIILGIWSTDRKRKDRLEKARLISEGLAAAHTKPPPST